MLIEIVQMDIVDSLQNGGPPNEGATRASAHGQRSILGPIIMSHRIYINCHILKSIIIILKSIIIAKQTHCFPKGSALLPSRNDILFVLIIDGKTVCVYYRHTFQRMSVISH